MLVKGGPGGYCWGYCPRVLVQYWVPNIQVSCRSLIIWQGTRMVAPAMTTKATCLTLSTNLWPQLRFLKICLICLYAHLFPVNLRTMLCYLEFCHTSVFNFTEFALGSWAIIVHVRVDLQADFHVMLAVSASLMDVVLTGRHRSVSPVWMCHQKIWSMKKGRSPKLQSEACFALGILSQE